MASKRNNRDTGGQLVLKVPQARSNPTSARGAHSEEEVRSPLAKDAGEARGPAPQDRRPDGADSPAGWRVLKNQSGYSSFLARRRRPEGETHCDGFIVQIQRGPV